MWAALSVLCCLATQAAIVPKADQTPAGSPPKPRMVLLELDARGIDPSVARTIDDGLSVAFARRGDFDVITPADLRAVLDVEGSRLALGGCSDGQAACMAEIAAALGAEAVVHGSVASLENQIILTVSAFDARTNRAVGREQVSGDSATALLPKIDVVADTLTRAWLGQPAAVTGGPNLVLLAVGGGTALAGAGLAVAGGVMASGALEALEDPLSPGVAKTQARGDYTTGTAVVGAALAVVALGLGVFAAGFLLE